MAKNQYSVLATKTMVGKDGKKNGVYPSGSGKRCKDRQKGAKISLVLSRGVKHVFETM